MTCPIEPRSKRGRPTRVGPFRMILAATAPSTASSAITRAPAEVNLCGTDEEVKDSGGLATPKVSVAVSPSAAQRYRQALGLNQCSRTRLAHWT